MFIFPVAGFTLGELDVGEAITFTKEVKGLRPGSATIKCHVHADIDQDSLFPKGENSPNGSVGFTVT